MRIKVALFFFFFSCVIGFSSYGQQGDKEYIITVIDSLNRKALKDIPVEIQIIRDDGMIQFGHVITKTNGKATLRTAKIRAGDILRVEVADIDMYKEFRKEYIVAWDPSTWVYPVQLAKKEPSEIKTATIFGTVRDVYSGIGNASVTYISKKNTYQTKTENSGMFLFKVPLSEITGDSIPLYISKEGYENKDVRIKITEKQEIRISKIIAKNEIKGKVVPKYKPDELKKNVYIKVTQDNHVLVTKQTDENGDFTIILSEQTDLDKEVVLTFTKTNLQEERISVIPNYQNGEILIEPERDYRYPATGIFIRLNGGLYTSGADQWIGKATIFWSTPYLTNRLAIGLEFTGMKMKYYYEIEPFGGNTQTNEEYKTDAALNLYGRVFFWPIDKPFKHFFNAYFGISLPWKLNNWEFELGVRPIQTRIFSLEVQGSYLLHKANIRTETFNAWGKATTSNSNQMFYMLYAGINLVFYLSGIWD